MRFWTGSKDILSLCRFDYFIASRKRNKYIDFITWKIDFFFVFVIIKEKKKMKEEAGMNNLENMELRISKSGKYFENGDGPFFWLGDTAWLMTQRCV